MLERFLGKHTEVGKVRRLYGDKIATVAFDIAILGITKLGRQPKGGLTDQQALERYRVFTESPTLQEDLRDLLAHSVKDSSL